MSIYKVMLPRMGTTQVAENTGLTGPPGTCYPLAMLSSNAYEPVLDIH